MTRHEDAAEVQEARRAGLMEGIDAGYDAGWEAGYRAGVQVLIDGDEPGDSEDGK